MHEHHNRWTKAALIGLVMIVTALAGCTYDVPGSGDRGSGDGPDGSSSNSGTGTVAFYVKDAPADELESLTVTFSKVTAHRAGGGENDDSMKESGANETGDDNMASPHGNETGPHDNDTAPHHNETGPGNHTAPHDNDTAPDNHTAHDNDTAPHNHTAHDNETHPHDNETSGGGMAGAAAGAGKSWVVLVNETRQVDLMAFAGDLKAFLGSADVAAGKYTQIRIEIESARATLADENATQVNVTVPSGTLKVVRTWTVVEGQTTSLIVDFVLEKSVHRTGNGEWMLKPVVKLIVDGPGEAKKDSAPAGGNETAEKPRPTGKPDDKGKPEKNETLARSD